MKTMRKVLCYVVAVATVSALIANPVETATKAKLNKKKVTLTITDSKKNPSTTLKVKGVSKKVAKKAKWSTSNKKVATVKNGKVTAKSAGKATVTCKVTSKKYICKVTVVDNKKVNNDLLNISIAEKASETGLGPDFPDHVYSRYVDYDAHGNEIDMTPGFTDDDLLRAGGAKPYGVNKITVTYDGKDVTNEVQYEIDEPQVACVTSPGIIEATRQGMLFKLTVLYKGAKKTFRMGKTAVPHHFIECVCGALFAGDKCSTPERDLGKECALRKHLKPIGECGGPNYYIVQYTRYIDIRIKE